MIKKAIIPVAGKGTRLMPVTSVVPKVLFPLVDCDGKIQCLMQILLEQTISTGIEQVGIVVSPNQINIIKQFLDSILTGGYSRVPAKIEYIIQSSPKGFGDAVLKAVDFIGDDSFILLLSDHLSIEESGTPTCISQVTEAFDSSDGVAMIGVQKVTADVLSKVGVTRGINLYDNIYLCSDFIEKPDLYTANKFLITDGLPEGKYLAHCGIYIFTPEIFDCLSNVGESAKRNGREIELADAQSLLLKRCPGQYHLCEITGRAYDIGTPIGYAQTQIAFRNSNKQITIHSKT